ncbi:uncharacterized protein MONBRDRAFT_31879 [Monosiga brevicollis MX1]|uniref:Protein kinase domain-containing protein n=1 Tax=Monosiga brevicollis TaxID=81824 RepID=A9UW00_MONBE|nr:uncharacterized protein MONBRDRAFT_31879 [Monosiga brevicollis MX1]EDQ90680.1 predicted protein [Monosiga brevicollis MX1]|eukprot:XP_001744731.1 hypothetical protein [Monosiga brevicollis MX1]
MPQGSALTKSPPQRASAKRRQNSPIMPAKRSISGQRKPGSNDSASATLDPASMQTRFEEMEAELQQYRKVLAAKDDELRDHLSFCQQTICHLVSEKSRQENRAARDNYLRNVQRLGWASAVRSGMHVHDVWNEGAAFRDIRQKQKALDLRKKQLEEEKRDLAKVRPVKNKKRSEGAADDGFSRPSGTARSLKSRLSEQDYAVKLEIIQLNLITIKTEEEGIKAQLNMLLRERNLHLREMKRITDEDNAKYRDLPNRLSERYLLCSLLGKGGFSEVYKAYDLREHRYVACKVHQLNSSWSDAKKQNYIKHATREYEIHRSLKHESVVEMHDVFEIDANSFCTVLEYCPGQDLDFLLKQEHRLPERDARNKIVQIVNALKYLNSVEPPVIHYDLKPANVLLRHGMVKITDFGLSKQVRDSDSDGNVDLTSQGAGTYWYLPPECFVIGSALPKISSKVDVWSVGVIFYQSLYGEKPFGHNLSQQSLLQNNVILNAREVRFPEKPKVSEEAKNFIRRCLTYDMRARPDVLTLSEDPYMRKRT